MSEFTPINTQEEFDKAIADRIKRAQEKALESAKEEYGDYDEIKSKNSEYKAQIEKLTGEMKEQTEKYAGTDKEIADLKEKVQSYETASVKTKIAHEEGLPYELAAKLTGETEEDIRKDAKEMAKFIKTNEAAPMASSEPSGKGNPEKVAQQKFVEWFENQEQ